MLYVTVGTGIGGGMVVDGQIYRGIGLGAAEIGHLRPGLLADRADQTVESLASGWGIAAAAQARISEPVSHPFVPLTTGLASRAPDFLRQRIDRVEDTAEEYVADLLSRAGGQVDGVTAKIVAQAAADGNDLARDVLLHAAAALGWAIAQAITLVSPSIVVVGGGVTLADEPLFFAPLRAAVDQYVFPPFAGSFRVMPAQLGELVVVHGRRQPQEA